MKKPILTHSNLIKTSDAVAMLIFRMLFFSVMPFTVFGQAPVITYSSPKTYLQGVAITALGPTTGGVAAPVYNGPVTLLSNYTYASGIAVDKAGNVYIANTYNSTISKIPAGGGSPVTVSTAFVNPVALAVDPTGNLYVETYGLYPNTNGTYAGYLYELPAGGGSKISLGSGLIGSGPSYYPYYNCFAVDALGNVYVGSGGLIIKIPSGGGSSTHIASGVDSPSGVAVDAAGNIYVADSRNYVVNKIPAGGGAPVTIASNTITPGFYPNGLAVDKSGNVFVACGDLLKMIPAAGGSPIIISSAFSDVIDITADGEGNIYAEDNGVSAVKEIKSFGAYAINPVLPAGLNLDFASGIISGTPTVSSPATNYTVTAYNSSGADSAVVNIKVLSNNANLTNLAISNGILTPAFATGTTNYTDGVLNTVKSVTVTPTVSDPTATVAVNGVTVGSGAASAPITLIPGPNVITTKVTAQDGITIKTYTTTVTQHPPSSDDNLSNIITSAGTPTLVQGSTVFTAYDYYSTSAITVTPTTENINATVKVNGIAVLSGSASASIPLKVGLNTITVTVTAEDGITAQSYTLKITRAESANCYLYHLTFSDVYLDPVFSGSTNISAIVYSGTTSTTVTPTAQDTTSTITVNGTIVKSGTASGRIALNPGQNVITIVVTAQDGLYTQTYLVNITKRLTSGIIYVLLNNLTISSGAFTPPFVQYTPNYTVSVGTATTSISVTPTSPDARDTVKVNGVVVQSGSASGAIPLNIGPNIVTVYVAAPYDYNTITYTIIVTRTSTANAVLANLAINSGTLTPAFAAGITAYTALVGNDITSVTLTPTTSDPLATVKVNGSVVAPGSASAAVPLAIGTNTITTVVTAADGITTKTYTTTVTRAASSNAYLTNLFISSNTNGAQFNPAFGNGFNYTIKLTNAISSLTVTATAYSSAATITVNGISTPLGSPSASIPLIVGDNTITVIVTAQDGITQQTYTIVATRLPVNPSTNSSLSTLVFSGGSLSPVFTAGTTSYVLNLSQSAGLSSITPTAPGVGATITVNGHPVASGSAYQIYYISNGGVFTIVVTAQDEVTTTTYSVTLNIIPSNNANLSNLALSGGTLIPAFNILTGSYAATVSNVTTSITVTPTTNYGAATVQINGHAVISTLASPDLPLSVGLNTITTVVTAQDRVTKKTYTVVVNRLPSVPSSDSGLAGLTLSSGTLSPAFSSGINSYTATVNSNTSVTVTPVTSDVNATVQVNGATVSSGTPSATVPLVVGANTITTVVTSQDGTSKTTYTIAVTVVPSGNANLINLVLSSGTLAPVFNILKGTYAATVSNATTSVTLTPTVNNTEANVQINGFTVASRTASPALPLAVGHNTITALVTAQDGVTKKTYTVVVNRLPLVPSANSGLAGLTLSSGTLSPVFTGTTTSYTALVNSNTSVTVTPVTSDVNATVQVNGATVNWGAASAGIPLAPGTNTINTVVTSQDGTSITTYTIVVTMVPSANANLIDLVLSSGTVTPVFNILNGTYTASVSNATTSVSVTPTVNNTKATVKVNGITVASRTASPPLPLAVGDNTITTFVTAQDGITKKTYAVTVTRASGSLELLRKDTLALALKPVDTLAANDGLLVHPALSPNGDGVNDYLVIDKITDYPDNNLKIMDRNGVLVFEARGYDNASRVFDGHSSKTGTMQLPGTYFYSLQYKTGNKSKYKTGYLVIKY